MQSNYFFPDILNLIFINLDCFEIQSLLQINRSQRICNKVILSQ